MANENDSELMVFLFGAAVGAVAGLLLAPKPGSETREQLGDWLKERREQGATLVNKLKEDYPEKTEKLRAAFQAGKEAICGKKETEEEEETIDA